MRKSLLLMIVTAVLTACGSSAVQQPIPESQEAFLDTLQERTFKFFWERANPANGLVPDRWPTPSFSSVAAVGFALPAYAVGAERGWITRDQAADRVLTTLRFLWNAPQGPQPTGVAGHQGFFYHFLDMQTGHRFDKVELSTIDTGLLMAGVLFSQQYFDGQNATETEIRSLADSLYRRVDWEWVYRPATNRLTMGWHPESGYIVSEWHGYDEAMILLVLALGSPTSNLDPSIWTTYTSTYKWGTYYGQEHVGFAPMFGHQYSHMFIDFRGIRDEYMRGRGIDYFENSRRAVLAQRAYAIDNPMGWEGYGEDVWGLTASDGPIDTEREVNGETRRFWSYTARGTSHTEVRDDGTIVPTATGGSIPFAPEVTIPVLQAMRDRYGEAIWGEYGFFDSFNPTYQWTDRPLLHGRVVPGIGWVDGDYLGIDQGPFVLMIENYRSGLIWEKLRNNPYIVRGLQRAGFTGGWLQNIPAAP